MAISNLDETLVKLLEGFITERNLVETYNNKCIDFETLDVVQCSYLKGLLK